MTAIPERSGGVRGWLAFGSVAAFVLLQFCAQGLFVTSVPQMSADLAIDASTSALLAALFFVTYAGVQIPVGLLLDRFGPVFILPAACLAMGLGAYWLAHANAASEVALCRLWLGAASAFAFGGAVLLAERRIAARWVPFCVGLTDASMGIGSALGGWLGAHEGHSWREPLVWCAWASVPVAVCMLAAIGRTNARGAASITSARREGVWSSLRSVIGNPRIRALAIAYFGLAGIIFGLAGYWNVPLQSAYGRTVELAADFGTPCFIALAVGAPLTGLLVARGVRPGTLLVWGAGICAFAWAVIVYVPRVDYPPVPIAFWALLGLSLSTTVLLFPLAVEAAGPAAAATAVTVVNMAGLVGAGVFQYLPGVLLDIEPQESSLGDLRLALSVQMIAIFVAWFVLRRIGAPTPSAAHQR